VIAYKPAADALAEQVVGDPVALRLRWEDPSSRLKAGQNVRALLQKAKEYRAKWLEYEQALARWTPPAEPPAEEPKVEEKKDDAEKKEGESKEGEKAEEKPADEKKAEGEKTEKTEKKDSKSKKKKGEPEELEPDPITGVWEADVTPSGGAPAKLKLRLKLAKPGESAAIEGNLRCDAASATLVEIEGWFDREKRALRVTGVGSKGWIELAAELKEEKLAGSLTVAGTALDATLARTSKDYVVAKRAERATKKEEPAKELKGKPKEPKRDDKLEPLRRAMDGQAALVIDVERAGDILACVETCARFGIRPILYGAREAHLVRDELVGRVAGVFLYPTVVGFDAKRGTDYPTPYADLQNAGLRVAFLSEAEEGAIDLPLRAAYAVVNGMSPDGAVRALTADAADMLAIGARVGRLAVGLDGDVLLLDGPPLQPETSVVRAWVNGEEVEAP